LLLELWRVLRRHVDHPFLSPDTISGNRYVNESGVNSAPRPVHSALDLSKLEATGFSMPDWEGELREYLASLIDQR
jgi:dTDP-4-dehydrorhamnose reductase